jgi:hypothetical protein
MFNLKLTFFMLMLEDFKMTLKKLPLGNQSFSEIIDHNLLYADKTEYVHKLVKSPKRNYFLLRPRRFGKTLLISTIEELFSGNRERFENLLIDNTNYDFPKHPTIRLSLSMDCDTPKILQNSLIQKLSAIAKSERLQLPKATFANYFGNLIKALYEQNNGTKVVVLIDEYDAPVTRQMSEQPIAEANAKVLHNFFATLKECGDYIHFTFVTGITRYALTSMDSGPNHLNDISLEPEYACICGFTIEEFDALFGERFEITLKNHNDKGYSIANIDDLRSLIIDFYDGYHFAGKTRVLNPFTILNYFSKSGFDGYWYQSGRPANLTSLMKARPLDFLMPKLESYLDAEVRNPQFKRPEAVPFLFHGGYLTLDNISVIQRKDPITNQNEPEKHYSFRFPNYEVSSSYRADCFSVIFGLNSNCELKNKGDELKNAFLAGNKTAVMDILSDFLSPVSYHCENGNQKHFHSFIRLVLSMMGFNFLSKPSAVDNKSDLCLILPDDVYLVIRLEYRKNPTKNEMAETDSVPANLAGREISIEILYRRLADAAMEVISRDLIHPIIKQATGTERERLLALFAIKFLTKDQINKILSDMAKKILDPKIVEEALRDAIRIDGLPKKKIDNILTKAAKEALNDISERGCPDLVKKKAKKIITLGLAIYGDGSHIAALFGQKKPGGLG